MAFQRKKSIIHRSTDIIKARGWVMGGGDNVPTCPLESKGFQKNPLDADTKRYFSYPGLSKLRHWTNLYFIFNSKESLWSSVGPLWTPAEQIWFPLGPGEAAKKYFFSGPATKRGGGGKVRDWSLRKIFFLQLP